MNPGGLYAEKMKEQFDRGGQKDREGIIETRGAEGERKRKGEV